MQEVFGFLKKCQTYYLATAEGDQPRVRPFGTVNIFNGRLYIQTGKNKDVSKQLTSNPKAELCAFDCKEWLRVAATLVEDDSIEAGESMLANYPELRPMYTPGDGNSTTFYLTDATATFSSFTAPPREVKF